MIDSIVIRIHNLKRYAAILEQVNGWESETVTKFETTKKTVDESQDKPLHFLLYTGSGNIVPLVKRTRCYIPSSSYNLNCYINSQADYLEFNFSIPKYLHANNVVQFVDYYNQSASTTFIKLKNFINEFLQQFVSPVSLYDVEIVQLDLCYNQIFQTKEDSLEFIRAMNGKIDDWCKVNGKMPSRSLTGYHMNTYRYCMKVYHKGTEFKKHDYYSLLNKGRKDVQKLLDVAERMCRYEISFKKKYFDYKFKDMYETGKLNAKKKTVYRYLYRALKIADGKHLSKKFMFKSAYDSAAELREQYPENWFTMFKNDTEVTFDFTLFNELYKFFWDFAKKMQPTTSGNNDVVKKLVGEINRAEKARNELSGKKGKMINEKRLAFWVDVSKKNNLKTMMKQGHLGKTQFYQLMKRFKKLGLSSYNPNIGLTAPGLGYADYKALFGSYHD